jgi:predicted polyphosphate/ATP-dependent NAD kinase
MHSAVFATSPAAAAAILAGLPGAALARVSEAEVIDRDAHDNMQLFGRLPVLAAPPRQAAKAAGPDADAALAAAVAAAAAELKTAPLCLIGPGLTMLALKQALGAQGTLLGVDVFADGRLLQADAMAEQLLVLTRDAAPRLVLGVVGGQGFLLGRGNQQLSPAVLDRVAWPPLVLASAAKLAALPGGRLLVESGDEMLDRRLAGHVAVRTGPRQTMMMRIDAA